MRHQPFEDWLLFGEPLDQEQERTLAEHLQQCPHCQQLQTALNGVETLFSEAGAIEPPSGFVGRWQARFEQERQARQLSRYQWQSWIMFVLVVNAAVYLAVLLAVQISGMVALGRSYLWVLCIASPRC